MRIAILSADVAGGHDAAARTLREQLLERRPELDVRVDNGLAAMGSVLHRFVRDGFRLQLGSSSGSYDVMLALLSSRPAVGALRAALGHAGGGGVAALVRERRPDVVVSTYPLVTSVLGHLRERGELDAPLVAPIADASPHAMWFHPAADLHLVPVPGDVERAREACPSAEVRHARPMIDETFLRLPERPEARDRAGLPDDGPWVLVDHSAWNVPPAHALVDPLLARSDARVVVMAAGFEDESEARELRERYAHTSRVQVRDDEEEKPLLYAACDFVVTTVASTTAFAALAAGTPAILFRELAGHGRASAEAASHEGLVLWARSEGELARIVSGAPPWPEVGASAVAAGRVLVEATPVPDEILRLA